MRCAGLGKLREVSHETKDGRPHSLGADLRSSSILSAIPFVYFQDELLLLNPVTAESVYRLLERFGTVALVTGHENAALTAAGYQRGCYRPDSTWSRDRVWPWKRKQPLQAALRNVAQCAV